MAVIEVGNRLYRTKLALNIKLSTAYLVKIMQVQPVHEAYVNLGSESMYMVTSCHTQFDQDFKCLCASLVSTMANLLCTVSSVHCELTLKLSLPSPLTTYVAYIILLHLIC